MVLSQAAYLIRSKEKSGKVRTTDWELRKYSTAGLLNHRVAGGVACFLQAVGSGLLK